VKVVMQQLEADGQGDGAARSSWLREADFSASKISRSDST